MAYRLRHRLATWMFTMTSLVLLYACDRLDEDVLPNNGEVIAGGSELFALAHSSATINLKALVKTQQPIQIKIVSLPQKGDLVEMEMGVLQYMPHDSFTHGEDGFRYNVLALDNTLLAQDSVIIIVSNEGDDLPCGLYAATDSATVVGANDVFIDVLANDVLCDSIDIKLEVYQPIGYEGQDRGGATVMNDMMIRYTSSAVSSGVDYFFYKVTSLADSSRYAIGRVSIRIEDSFQNPDFTLLNDSYTFKKDTLVLDTLRLYVFGNDNLPGTGYTTTIFEQPHHAVDAKIHGLTSLEYVFDNVQAPLTDSLTYQVCKESQCKTAKVYVNIQ